MGCTQSKIDNEESVSRCKERRNFMKEAVSARNAFASAHSGYGISLKNTGAALNDYAQGEAPPSASADVVVEPSLEPPRPPPPPESPFPPPPPPLPSFSPSPVAPLQRSMTMPEFSSSKPTRVKMKGIDENEDEDEEEEIEEGRRNGRSSNNLGRNGVEGSAPETPVRTPNPPPPPEIKGMAWDYFFMVDNIPGSSLAGVEEEDDYIMEEERGNESQNFDNLVSENDNGVDFKTPEKSGIDRGVETEDEVTPLPVNEKQFMHSNTAPPVIRGGESSRKAGSSGVELLKILSDVDDHFLKASENAQEVSKMLEATRMHYHSNFADNRGD